MWLVGDDAVVTPSGPQSRISWRNGAKGILQIARDADASDSGGMSALKLETGRPNLEGRSSKISGASKSGEAEEHPCEKRREGDRK